MEEIIIPDIEKIARVVAKTIDRFTNFAEAISVTEEGRACHANVSKLSVCRAIMMELADTNTDFDGLFGILQNVILTLVSDSSSGCCRTNETELPNLTSQQREALNKTVTFDKLLVKELNNQVKKLRQLVKKHKKILANDEKYRRESTKYEQKLAAILYQLHGSTPMKSRLLFFLQMKRDRAQKELVRTQSACRISGDLERAVRSQIKKLSDDIMVVINDKIDDRLDNGVEIYMLDVISKMNELKNRRKSIEWIRHLNHEDMTDRLVAQCSDTYVMRGQTEPKTVANDDSTLADVSSCSGSVAECTPVEEITLDSTTGEMKSALPDCDGYICRKMQHCSGIERNKLKQGIIRRTVTKARVTVERNVDKWSPGFIEIQPGMVTRQTARGQDEHDVGFGYHRPKRWGTKQWGFYFVKATN